MALVEQQGVDRWQLRQGTGIAIMYFVSIVSVHSFVMFFYSVWY